MKLRLLAITSLASLAMSHPSSCLAEKQGPSAQGLESRAVPEVLVPCTGWHAFCGAATDCRMNGNMADCDCLRVNETHLVAPSEIQDPVLRRLTEAKCTNKHPCGVDEAPICKTIRDGQYTVDGVKYQWVSTFSFRGWCDYYKPKACDRDAPGYAGDRYWAICDVAPCTESANPSDPERPLTCQCRVEDSSFVGTKNSCTGDNGGLISAMPIWVWDFERDTWTMSFPEYDYPKGACAALKSDAFVPE
jgi:hypothetical protein